VSPGGLIFKMMHHSDTILGDCWLDGLNRVGFEALTAVIFEEFFEGI
jgi:hypothetical protein